MLTSAEVKALHNGRRSVSHSYKKGVRQMRITVYIGNFTITVIIRKKQNRHSAK